MVVSLSHENLQNCLKLSDSLLPTSTVSENVIKPKRRTKRHNFFNDLEGVAVDAAPFCIDNFVSCALTIIPNIGCVKGNRKRGI